MGRLPGKKQWNKAEWEVAADADGEGCRLLPNQTVSLGVKSRTSSGHISVFSEGEEESGGSNGLFLLGFFGREGTFVQHKYAVDLNSIFPNLSLLGMLLQAVPYRWKKTVDFWFLWKHKRSRFFITKTLGRTGWKVIESHWQLVSTRGMRLGHFLSLVADNPSDESLELHCP